MCKQLVSVKTTINQLLGMFCFPSLEILPVKYPLALKFPHQRNEAGRNCFALPVPCSHTEKPACLQMVGACVLHASPPSLPLMCRGIQEIRVSICVKPLRPEGMKLI